MSSVVRGAKKIFKAVGKIAGAILKPIFGAIFNVGQPPSTADQAGRQRMQRTPNAPHEIVYGRTAKSGVCVLCEETGADREYLHLVIALAPHQVKSIGTVYFNDKPSTEYPAEYFRIKKHLGSPTQVADADLVSEVSKWTSNHRLQGIAYIYVRLKYDKEGKVWTNGVPNIKCEMEGKNDIWDPRTDTYGYSENAALCMLDYGLSPQGAKIDPLNVPISKWIAAANACDELVAKPGGGSEPRYTLNGVVKTDSPIAQNFDAMVTAMAGHWSMTLSGFVAVPGVYQGAPVVELTDDDFVSDININPRSGRKDTFNVVRGQFIDPDSVYLPTDFPEVRDTDLVNQFGEDIVEDIELPFTISAYMAQRIAKLMLARNKSSLTANFETTSKGVLVPVGENIALTNTLLGWQSYGVRVTDVGYNPADSALSMTVSEDSAAMYDYADGNLTVYNPPPRTSLPNSFDIPAPTNLAAVNVHVIAPTGQLKVGVKCSWTKPAFAFVRDYEVQWSPAGQNQWTGYIATEPTDTLEGLVEGDVIDIRVRTVANWGSASDWLTLTNHTVTAKAIPPGGPSSLSVTGGYRRLNLTWSLPADPDVKLTEIYVSPTNDLNNALLLAKVAAPSTFYRHAVDPSVTNYYWIRCKDTSGNYSVWHPTNTTGIGATSSNFDYGDFSGNLPMINMPDGVNNDLLTYNQIRNPGLFGALADFNEADWSMHVANRPPNLSALSGIEAIRNDSLIQNDLMNGAGWAMLPESGATLGADWYANLVSKPPENNLLNNLVNYDNGAPPSYHSQRDFDGTTFQDVGELFLISDLGLVVGDVVAISAEVWSDDGQTLDMRHRFYDGAQSHVGVSNGGQYNSTSTPTRIYGFATIPVGTVYMAIAVRNGNNGTGSGTNNQHWRRAQVYKGEVELPYIPVRLGGLQANNTNQTVIGPGSLVENLGINQGDGTIRRAPFGLGAGVIRDGGSHVFNTAFNTPPIIKFRGGVTFSTTLTGKQNLISKAINVSTTGFDCSAKIKELAGSTTLNTDSGSTANVDGYDFVMHKSVSAQAWDDNYQFQIDVTVNNQYDEELDNYFPGVVKVGYYTNDGGGWVKRGEKTFNGSSAGPTTTYVNDEHTISVDGLTNHAGREFAVTVLFLGTNGGQINAFDNVKYYTATAPNEETGTPSGAEDLIFELLAGE